MRETHGMTRETGPARQKFTLTRTSAVGYYYADEQGGQWSTFALPGGGKTNCCICGDEINSGYVRGPLDDLHYYCRDEVTCVYPPKTAPAPATPTVTRQVEIHPVMDPMHKGKHIYSVRCPFGHEYSATASDYFMARPSREMLCHEHEDKGGAVDPQPCRLAEKVYVWGTDASGLEFSTAGWRTIKDAITVDDLLALERGELVTGN